VMAGPATIEAPPRPEAQTNGAPVPVRPAKKRMLIIVNPYATTVSDRLKNLVVYALQGRYDVEAVLTEAQHHATEIGREACEGGYDIVVAFGGDGTLNEVANGLAGTDVPVSVLPGGSTNVVARTLGIPNDVVDATEHLLSLADDFQPRRVDLGIANGRRLVFACGAGLDVTAIAQNSDPFTYFGSQPLRVCENAALDNGTLSIAMLRRAAQRDVPTIATRVLVKRLRTPRHRQIDHLDGVTDCRIESVSRDAEGRIKPFPVQVDGDYIGDHGELELGIEPAALSVVA
jgi:diacylglycerol kinase family enzyme